MTEPSIQATPPAPEPVPQSELSLEAQKTFAVQAVLRFTLVFAIVHIVLWCIAIGLLLLYVPPALAQFREFDLQLSLLTQVVAQLAWLAESSFTAMPLLLGLWLLFEVPLLGILRQRSRRAGWVWGVLHVILPLLFIALIVYAIETPKANLAAGLNR